MKTNRRKGIIQILLLILIAIITLSYFGIDLEAVFDKPLIKKNIIFTWTKTKDTFTTYVYNPISNLFNKDKSADKESSSDTDGEISI